MALLSLLLPLLRHNNNKSGIRSHILTITLIQPRINVGSACDDFICSERRPERRYDFLKCPIKNHCGQRNRKSEARAFLVTLVKSQFDASKLQQHETCAKDLHGQQRFFFLSWDYDSVRVCTVSQPSYLHGTSGSLLRTEGVIIHIDRGDFQSGEACLRLLFISPSLCRTARWTCAYS